MNAVYLSISVFQNEVAEQHCFQFAKDVILGKWVITVMIDNIKHKFTVLLKGQSFGVILLACATFLKYFFRSSHFVT